MRRFLRRLPLNVATRKVGGLRFIKIGRLTLAFSVSREFRPFTPAREAQR